MPAQIGMLRGTRTFSSTRGESRTVRARRECGSVRGGLRPLKNVRRPKDGEKYRRQQRHETQPDQPRIYPKLGFELWRGRRQDLGSADGATDAETVSLTISQRIRGNATRVG